MTSDNSSHRVEAFGLVSGQDIEQITGCQQKPSKGFAGLQETLHKQQGPDPWTEDRFAKSALPDFLFLLILLVSTPLVIVSGRRVVVPRFEVRRHYGGIRIPIDFDVIDVAIHETDHIPGVVKLILFPHQFLRLMPGVGVKRWLFRDENCFCGVFYGGQFTAGNAGKLVRQGIVPADVSCVEKITCIIELRQQMAGYGRRAADVFGQAKCVGWAGKKRILR